MLFISYHAKWYKRKKGLFAVAVAACRVYKSTVLPTYFRICSALAFFASSSSARCPSFKMSSPDPLKNFFAAFLVSLGRRCRTASGSSRSILSPPQMYRLPPNQMLKAWSFGYLYSSSEKSWSASQATLVVFPP